MKQKTIRASTRIPPRARGARRPFEFASVANAGGGDGADIGAFELGAPRLNIQRTGNAALLSWPSCYGDFSAQSVTGVTASNSRAGVLGTPVLDANQYVLTNSPVSGSKFFRLKAP